MAGRVQEMTPAEAAQMRMRAAMSRAMSPAALGALAAGARAAPAPAEDVPAAKPTMMESVRNWYAAEWKDKKRREANVKCLTQLGIFVGLSLAIVKLGKRGMQQFDMAENAANFMQAQQMMMQ